VSPRWLAQHGRVAEAERVTAAVEARVAADLGRPLPEPAPPVAEAGGAGFAEIWRPPYRRRTVMLAVVNFFQTVGYYGFNNWMPALLEAQGASASKSLHDSFLITLTHPVAPLLCSLIADRFERKWQIVGAAFGIGVFGLLFARESRPGLLILFGVLITASNNLLSYSYHAYQAELFPTRIRARAVGFVYSFSRLSTVFTSFPVGLFLQRFGARGVFGIIAFSMAVVIVSIGAFGPRTNGLALEEISAGQAPDPVRAQ
jgi:putative MFS transporter